MEKDTDAFRTISEVADDLDLPQHVLRFWETRFAQIKPLKRGGGRRYYRPDDVALVRAIRHLLYGEGYTIKGVQRILKEQGVRALIHMSVPGAVDPAPQAEPENGAAADAFLGPAHAFPDAGSAFSDAPVAGQGRNLQQAHAGILRGALAELEECARLLAAAGSA